MYSMCLDGHMCVPVLYYNLHHAQTKSALASRIGWLPAAWVNACSESMANPEQRGNSEQTDTTAAALPRARVLLRLIGNDMSQLVPVSKQSNGRKGNCGKNKYPGTHGPAKTIRSFSVVNAVPIHRRSYRYTTYHRPPNSPLQRPPKLTVLTCTSSPILNYYPLSPLKCLTSTSSLSISPPKKKTKIRRVPTGRETNRRHGYVVPGQNRIRTCTRSRL